MVRGFVELHRSSTTRMSSWLSREQWVHARDLLRELIARDMKLRYRGSVLGMTSRTRLGFWILLCLQTMGYAGCTGSETRSRSVTFQRVVHADEEPGNWLTYSRTYDGQRFSPLAEINRENVQNLQLQWVFPIQTAEPVETTPLVVDGVMYLTKPVNDVVALNASTGEKIWEFSWPAPKVTDILCCGKINRGLAILGDTLYLGTLDAHLVAIDSRSGQKKWDVEIGDPNLGYTLSAAPLAVKDMVIVGTVISQAYVGLERNGVVPEARGYIDAHDAATGAPRWRFYTVPGQGEVGNQTWGGHSWREGRSSAWLTGSYDPELNLVYWGIGNPAPAFHGDMRSGDNLYSSSAVALDADTGRLKWHFQFTPHDEHDWDAAQIFVLTDTRVAGRERKVLLNANRNGFFYALDRQTGEFLFSRPYAKQSWSRGFDGKGRPILEPDISPTRAGTVVSPNADGATSWWSPSLSTSTGLFYVTAHDGSETYFLHFASGMERVKGEISAFVRAIDPQTGVMRWQSPISGISTAGILTTAGGLLFSGNHSGEVFALDAATGKTLWRDNIGGWVHSAPISYRSGDSQFVAVATSQGVYSFAHPSTRLSVAKRVLPKRLFDAFLSWRRQR